MAILRAAIFAALFIWAGLSPANADDVTLTSRDGSVEIVGTLLGYDGEFYRVDTVYGVLTVDGAASFAMAPVAPICKPLLRNSTSLARAPWARF